jgi:hypothetical protein
MDIQTLSKVIGAIGEHINDYISTNAGKLHLAPHKDVLAFAQSLRSSVILTLQKDIKPVVVDAPAKTDKVVKAAKVAQEKATTEVEKKRRGRPARITDVEVVKEIANAPQDAVIKKASKSKKLANKILTANGLEAAHGKVEVTAKTPKVEDENEFSFDM